MEQRLCISRLHGHIHPPEVAELTQHMIPIDTIDVVNVHLIQLTTTGDPHKSRLLRLTLKHFPLILGPRMSQFPFTCPAAMAVQLLTLTIILAVAFAQEFHDAYYKRLPPGYSYGYLQTNPSEKFYKRESLPECAFYALNSQSEFFTYNDVSRVKLVISKNQTNVVTMIFNGRNTTIESWFSHKNLKSSPWNDLASATELEFSIKGHKFNRRFYITIHGNCDGDRGWLTINEGPLDCQYENSEYYPLIRYSDTKSKVVWNNGLLRLTLKHFPLMLEPRMSQFPFTCPAAMAVQLLTFTIILVVAFAQEFNDAYYERLPPGYSYGYLQTNPSEKFYKRESLLECTGIALQSQSEFFTYNDVSRVCKNYSPKDIMTVVSTSDSNEIAFYRLLGTHLRCGTIGLCISRLHGHIHPPEAAELTQHMISIDTIDVVNVHPIQLTTTGDPHKSRFTC
ncbi:Hypothetical predicted protein [Octopus vulgaris]|uniref:Uncharacterized protein n=1 Tax=Octopus vulgaris TaxID=6645 RepID=A0AA36BY42_OCTVU|nr:Hypothetical predicted protein [Octopus vulgaris]